MKTGTKVILGIVGVGVLVGGGYLILNNPFMSDDKKAVKMLNNYLKKLTSKQRQEVKNRVKVLNDLGEKSLLVITTEVIANIDSGNLPLPTETTESTKVNAPDADTL